MKHKPISLDVNQEERSVEEKEEVADEDKFDIFQLEDPTIKNKIESSEKENGNL